MENTAYIRYGKIIYIKTEKIISNDNRMQRQVTKNNIFGLIKSIQQYGIIEPISVINTVRGYYKIVSGERRVRAARALSMPSVPAVVINTGSRDAAMLSVISSYSHCFNFIEEAEAYQGLMAEYGYSPEEIAEKTGKTIKYVYDKLKLLELKHCMRDKIIFHNVTEDIAECIVDIKDDELREIILTKVIKYGLNLERTEKLIKSTLDKINNENKPKQMIEGHINDIRLFTNSVKASVEMMNEAGVKTDYKVDNNDDGYTVTINVKWKSQS